MSKHGSKPTFIELVRVLENPDVPMDPDKRGILRELESRARQMEATLRYGMWTRATNGRAVGRVTGALRARFITDEVRRDVVAVDDQSGDLGRLLGTLEAYWNACRKAHELDRPATAARAATYAEAPARGIVGSWQRIEHASEGGPLRYLSPRRTSIEIAPLDPLVWGRTVTLAHPGAEPTTFVLKWLELGRSYEFFVEDVDGDRQCTVRAANIAEVLAVLVAQREHSAFPDEPLGEHAEIREGYALVTPCGGLCRFDAVCGSMAWIEYRLGDADPLHVEVRLRRRVTARVEMIAGRGEILLEVSGLPVTTPWTAALSMAIAYLDQRCGRGIEPVPRS